MRLGRVNELRVTLECREFHGDDGKAQCEVLLELRGIASPIEFVAQERNDPHIKMGYILRKILQRELGMWTTFGSAFTLDRSSCSGPINRSVAGAMRLAILIINSLSMR